MKATTAFFQALKVLWDGRRGCGHGRLSDDGFDLDRDLAAGGRGGGEMAAEEEEEDEETWRRPAAEEEEEEEEAEEEEMWRGIQHASPLPKPPPNPPCRW